MVRFELCWLWWCYLCEGGVYNVDVLLCSIVFYMFGFGDEFELLWLLFVVVLYYLVCDCVSVDDW